MIHQDVKCENLIFMYYKLGPFNKSDWYFLITWEMKNLLYLWIISQIPSLQEQDKVYNYTYICTCSVLLPNFFSRKWNSKIYRRLELHVKEFQLVT